MGPTASSRRWLVGRWLISLFFIIALVGVVGEDDDDEEDVFEDPDEPIVKKQKKATKPKGAAREYNIDGSRKKRDLDKDNIDEIVLKQQEEYSHELYNKAQAMVEQAKKWGGIEMLDKKKYISILNEAEKKLTEVWEEGKPSEKSLIMLGTLSRREKKIDEKPDDRTLEERLMKAATYYYSAAQRHNSTEGIYMTGKIIQLQAQLKGKQGDKEKEEELYKKANEFYGSATARGSMLAMTDFAEMCSQGKGWPDNVCPYQVAQEVYRFFEHLANATPGGVTYNKVAYAWAEGFGKDRISMPEACEWNDKAIKANDKAIKEMGGKVKYSEMDEKGIAVDAYLLRAACLYNGNYVGTGSPDMRTDARSTLKKMFRLQNMKKKDRDAKYKDTEKNMFGPEEDPDLVATIRWDRDVDGYGLRWFVLIWGRKELAYTYSMSRRETHKCKLQIGQGGEDEPPIFQCEDGSGMRLVATDMAEDGKMKGACMIKSKSGPVSGAFDMEPSVPLHMEM
mmetsp:Transcript_128645/g.222993  ORF Transcript_128645/g.222993 Transcript_128645/m.222993 type:complete len:507 (-) Transcript_128645:129-1649(-)